MKNKTQDTETNTTNETIRAARLASANYSRVLSVSYFGSLDQANALEVMRAADIALRLVRDARRAAGLCCTQHVGVDRFVCNNLIDPTAECSACAWCQDAEENRVMNCEMREARRHDER